MIKGWKRTTWIAVLAAAGLTLAGEAVKAEEFPAKEVTLISPWGPGGLNDVLSRAIAQHSEKFLGQPIVVENMPGGGGVVGTKRVERADADGYMLLMASSSTIFTQYTSSSPNDIKRLGPVIQICISPQVLVANASAPWKDLPAFLADAKAKPGKVTVSNSGAGGSSDLYTTLLEEMTGIKVKRIPYKGYAAAMTAVLGGHVGATIVPPGVAKQYVASGKAKVLGVATEKRFAGFPDAPTFKEQGIDLVINHWVGLMGPASNPQDKVDVLVKALEQGMKTPEFQKLLKQRGLAAQMSTGADFQQYIAQEDKKWRTIIKGE
jgi:putative tricarboxylic transport membrane protein